MARIQQFAPIPFAVEPTTQGDILDDRVQCAAIDIFGVAVYSKQKQSSLSVATIDIVQDRKVALKWPHFAGRIIKCATSKACCIL